mmetsp:Transcript_22819/g.66621  ORF Transcript_22819/g.66621 Transcript_22819/m.66621 type:complete len:311 (-) Transcript_22819:386-1318(-)
MRVARKRGARGPSPGRSAGAVRWLGRPRLERGDDGRLGGERGGRGTGDGRFCRRRRAGRLRGATLAGRRARRRVAPLRLPSVRPALSARAALCGARRGIAARAGQDVCAPTALARPSILSPLCLPRDALASDPRALRVARVVRRRQRAASVAAWQHRLPHGGRWHAVSLRDRVDAPVGPHGRRVVSNRVPWHFVGGRRALVPRHARRRRLSHQLDDVAERWPIGDRPVELRSLPRDGIAGPERRVRAQVGAGARWSADEAPPRAVEGAGGDPLCGGSRARRNLPAPHRARPAGGSAHHRCGAASDARFFA